MLANAVDRDSTANFDYGSSMDKPAQACDQVKMF